MAPVTASISPILRHQYLCYDVCTAECSDYFADFATFCFKTFGDRVKMWATINEPRSIARQVPHSIQRCYEIMTVS